MSAPLEYFGIAVFEGEALLGWSEPTNGARARAGGGL